MTTEFGLMFAGAVLALFFFLNALFRISASNLADGVKLGWIITILLLPIAGSFCALVVIKKN